MSVARRLKLYAAASLAGLTLASAGAGLVALNAGGAVGVGDWRIMELAAGYDRAADQELRHADRADLARVEARTRRALALSPYDVAAWLRLAYVDAARHGGLTPAGVAALARSYDLVAYDSDQASWRIAFALEHWGALPPQVQAQVRAEAFAFGLGWRHRLRMLEALRSVRNPSGRVIAHIWASQIESEPWR